MSEPWFIEFVVAPMLVEREEAAATEAEDAESFKSGSSPRPTGLTGKTPQIAVGLNAFHDQKLVAPDRLCRYSVPRWLCIDGLKAATQSRLDT